MKVVAKILEISGLMATVIAFAYAAAFSIDPGTCKRIVIGPFGWLVPLATFGFVIGTRAVNRNEMWERTQLRFWLFSAVFFASHSQIVDVQVKSTVEQKRQLLIEVFSGEIPFSRALVSLAVFYEDVIYIWMPFVSAVSLIAFAFTFIKCRRQDFALAERAGGRKTALP